MILFYVELRLVWLSKGQPRSSMSSSSPNGEGQLSLMINICFSFTDALPPGDIFPRFYVELYILLKLRWVLMPALRLLSMTTLLVEEEPCVKKFSSPNLLPYKVSKCWLS